MLELTKYLLVYLSISLVSSFAQSLELGGLQFNSRDFPLEKRTSLDLTKYKNIEFRSDFAIEFDIAFQESKFIGPIYRISSKSYTSELLFVPYVNPDSVWLKLINNDSTLIKLPIAKSNLIPSNWFRVKVNYQFSKQSISFTISDTILKTNDYEIPSSLSGKLVFGRRPFFGSDTPKMILRNIKYYENGKVVHHWPLNELSGANVSDTVGDLVGFVENPNWILPSHFHWKKIAEIGEFKTIHGSEDEGVNILLDSKNHQLLFVYESYLFRYDLVSGNIVRENFVNNRVQPRTNQVWNENKNKIQSHYSGKGNVVEYNPFSRQWGSIDTTGESKREYYGHNLFVNPSNGDLFMMNGYGWYKTKNDLQKYNFSKAIWENVKVKGEFFKPRRDAVIGKYDEYGKFLIFGGVGNSSGKQEDGFKHLFDLHLLDLADSSIKKLWDFPTFNESLLPLGNIYTNLKENCFYVAMANISSPQKSKRLYKFSITKPEYWIVSDSIGGGDINWRRGILFSSFTNKFYIANKIKKSENTYSLALYELLNVPISEADFYSLLSQNNTKSVSLSNKFFIIAIISIGSIILFYLSKRNQKKKSITINSNQNHNHDAPKNFPNSIYLFGNFQVINTNGEDITFEFTPKLRQLFFLLLIKSYNGNNYKLTTDELSTILWPDYSPEQVKNNRNVSISKLRTILNKLNKAEIINDKNTWGLQISPELYCDYIEFINMLKSQLTLGHFPTFLQIISRGELLKEVNFDWFESQKIHITEAAINNLKVLLHQNNLKNPDCISISNCILQLDPVNEDGLSAKIKSLVQAGDHSLAKSTYEHFKKAYYSLYAEEYPKSYSEILI